MIDGKIYVGTTAEKIYKEQGGPCPNYASGFKYDDKTCVYCAAKYHCYRCKRTANLYGTGHGPDKCKQNKIPIPVGIEIQAPLV